jgi:hypothetical protein
MVQNLYISPKYLRRTASVVHAGEFLLRIKRFECENFRFEAPCRRIDDRKSLAFIMYHVLYTSNIEYKVSENISPTKEE